MAETAPQAPFADPEKAREAASRSVSARKLRDELRKAPPDAQIEAATPQLVAELLDAALGRGDFRDLKAGDRLKALQTALAYGLGRPGTAKQAEPTPEAPTAAALFGVPTPE